MTPNRTNSWAARIMGLMTSGPVFRFLSVRLEFNVGTGYMNDNVFGGGIYWFCCKDVCGSVAAA
jgi:hypothetical protein